MAELPTRKFQERSHRDDYSMKSLFGRWDEQADIIFVLCPLLASVLARYGPLYIQSWAEFAVPFGLAFGAVGALDIHRHHRKWGFPVAAIIFGVYTIAIVTVCALCAVMILFT
jgi:hypothetical protein